MCIRTSIVTTVLLGIALATSAGTVPATGPQAHPENRGAPVTFTSGDVIWTLLLAPPELPDDLVLRSAYFAPTWYQLSWVGSLQGQRRTVSMNVEVSAILAASPEAAADTAHGLLKDAASPIPEITGQETEYSRLGDRVWHSGGGRIVFAKGRVVCDVYVYIAGTAPQDRSGAALGVATALARRADAFLAGKPQAVPVIPFLSSRGTRDGVTTEEQGVEWAWAVKRLQESWGEQGTTLVFIDSNGLPRGIPAKRLGEKEYLVHLKHAVKLLDPKGSIDPHLAGATFHGPRPNYHEVTMLGKKLRVTRGDATVTVEGQQVALDHPAETVGEIVLVPISSFAEKALGVKVEFSKHGDLPKITLKPGGAVGK